ncbi:hypothetical protein [Polymorphobacter sp.]|uniref:hypothetical protein n=1 Tax=Polymorphobacter sp. TaxID=1909290 RepID=UPI003F7053AD
MPKHAARRFSVASWLLVLGICSSAASQPAVPPPLEQRQADCARPQYASDTLVCSDPGLRALDAEVATLADRTPPLADGAIWEDQAAWQRRRSLCAFKPDHRACLAAAYADRQAVLAAALAETILPLLCDGALRGRTLASSAASDGQALTITEGGRLVAVARFHLAADRLWQPWLSWQKSGRRLVLRPQAGKSVRCTLPSS